MDHNRYLSMRITYLSGDTALVNCDLLGISGLLFSK